MSSTTSMPSCLSECHPSSRPIMARRRRGGGAAKVGRHVRAFRPRCLDAPRPPPARRPLVDVGRREKSAFPAVRRVHHLSPAGAPGTRSTPRADGTRPRRAVHERGRGGQSGATAWRMPAGVNEGGKPRGRGCLPPPLPFCHSAGHGGGCGGGSSRVADVGVGRACARIWGAAGHWSAVRGTIGRRDGGGCGLRVPTACHRA